MPTRPAIHQPHFAKTPEQRARIERDRQRAKDAARPSSTERGYDRDWRALRLNFLSENSTCCAPGCRRPATDADHIEDVRAHPERRLDITNLRAFCHQHHAQRTARDQGFARRREDQGAPRVSTRGSLHPDWLRPSRVPLSIVCGPPGAGKAAYVEQHASFTDIVLELEEIRAQLSGLPLFAPGRGWFSEALHYRNAALGNLSSPYVKVGGCWLVVPAPSAERRLWWSAKLRPLRVLVLATPADQCHAAIDADPRRRDVAGYHHHAVDRWWREYEPMAGERVLVDRNDHAR